MKRNKRRKRPYPKFFCDENISEGFANGMAEFGQDIVHVNKTHGAGTPDEDWLPFVGERGLVYLTRDAAIRHNPEQLKLVKEHSVGGFVLRGKSLSECDIIEAYVRNWRNIKEKAAKTRKPFLYALRPNGGGFVLHIIDLDTGKQGKQVGGRTHSQNKKAAKQHASNRRSAS